VRGEGSGAVFIKRLSQAEADGDPIYAVIKATAENHGGRVTMLTAPNPKAQAQLLVESYEKAQIDPTTVGYIECHGTGTSLGDPIEIQALKKSFSDLYKKHDKPEPAEPHCALSSVKTNIGHLEPAAGIASLLKVLLAMKHKQIPALLHFEELNPYIDLGGSPFYIADKTLPWEAPKGADGSALPRRAGVSSFGWGGANAHVVLEEHVEPQRLRNDGRGRPQLVVLSAKNAARLKAYAASLLKHLQSKPCDLADLAYTLQVGRDAMDERLGVIVDSIDELTHKLRAYVDGATTIEGMALGHVSRYKLTDRGLSVVASDEGGATGDIDRWMADADLARLLQAWVGGADIAWNRLHESETAQPMRVSLPTYPFARDRHWIEAAAGKKAAAAGKSAAALHPLLHENISTLTRHAYSTTFSGKEFFIADHAQGLPAAAYLEMARAAALCAKPMPEGASGFELRDVRWAPMASQARTLVIDVFEGRGGALAYEVHHAHPQASGPNGHLEKVVHCHGTVRVGGLGAPASFDFRQIRGMMTQGVVEATRLEAALRKVTPQRGAALRAMKAVHLGYHQLLVHLQVPPSVEHTLADYVLHPAMMDSLMQSALLLAVGLDPAQAQSSRPVALESLQLLSPCSRELHAWVRFARGSHPGDETPRLDIDVMDEQGGVCLRIRSLAFKNAGFKPASTGESEFAALLDAAYTQPVPDMSTDEFEKIIEEIL